jgi:tRNA(adenine34) deaminase
MISIAKGNCIFSLNFTKKKMLSIYSDEHFMKEAFREASFAASKGEIPVGAVIVCENRIIARGSNRTEQLGDITAHAEIIAITAAADFLGSKYLTDCTLFVTLEPCPMCAGALYWSQLSRIVYGASDEKRGFMKFGKDMLHPQTTLSYGVMEPACRKLLQDFFIRKRG